MPSAHSRPSAAYTRWPPRNGRQRCGHPPPGQLRVIIDTDAANEIDDQYALALALGSPERIRPAPLVATDFGRRIPGDSPQSESQVA